MASSSVTLHLDEKNIARLCDFYRDASARPTNDSIAFLARLDEVTITVYKKSKNGLRTVLFQGSNAEYESSIWGESPASTPEKKTGGNVAKGEQIGSDEVGVGDFFGPVIVVAAYVGEKDFAELKELGVTDSKKMSDDYIRQIGPRLMETYEHSRFTLSVSKYNEVIAKGTNLNAIKAKMHNAVLLDLHKKHPTATAYQDQFAIPKTYFSYLRNEKEVLSSIVFATKGESKFPCVALASVIARYSFLLKMDELKEKYGMDFPYGAGPAVDRFAERFLKKYGEAELGKVAKVHFANYKRLFA